MSKHLLPVPSSHGQPFPIRQRSNIRPLSPLPVPALLEPCGEHSTFAAQPIPPPPPPLTFPTFRSADGAFNAALLLERGDPFSAVASAAGLSIISTRHHASSSPQLPLRSSTLPLGPRESAATAPASTTTGGGSNGTNSSRHRNSQHCQRRQRDDIGVDDDNDDDGQSAADFHRRGKDDERQTDAPEGGLPSAAGAMRKKLRAQSRGGVSRNLWGDRPRALRMFERAAELGHTGATREVHRLRLRERMDHLVGHGREHKAS